MDAMEIWKTEWAPVVFVEAMRFWFFSLLFSLAISFLQLFQLYTAPPAATPTLKPKSDQKAKEVSEKTDSAAVKTAEAHEFLVQRGKIAKRIVTDACDLLIPGSIIGWIAISSTTVGMTSVVSTVLPSMDIWERVQKNASL